METKHIIAIAIAIAVGAITLSTVLVPAISMGTDTEDTFTNDGYLARMTFIDETTDGYSFAWDHTNPTVASVNGESVNLFNGSLISGADTFLARFGQDSTGYYIQWVPSSGLATVSYSAGTGTADLTIEISDGTATITRTPAGSGVGNETVNTIAISEGYAISSDGDYIMKSPNQKAYLNSDSRIYGMGLTTIDNVYYNGFYLDGTIENMTVEQFNPNPATYTISNVAVNYDTVSGYEDLYTLDSVTFTATQIANSSIVKDCTYNYIVVPYEVTAELSVHASAPVIQIFNMLPIFVALGLIVAVIGVAYVKYRR